MLVDAALEEYFVHPNRDIGLRSFSYEVLAPAVDADHNL